MCRRVSQTLDAQSQAPVRAHPHARPFLLKAVRPHGQLTTTLLTFLLPELIAANG
jgi:hypothetical protein